MDNLINRINLFGALNQNWQGTIKTNSEERLPVSEDGADTIQSVSASESPMVVGLAETPSDGITGGLVHVVVYPDLPREGLPPVTWFQRSQVFFLVTRQEITGLRSNLLLDSCVCACCPTSYLCEKRRKKLR